MYCYMSFRFSIVLTAFGTLAIQSCVFVVSDKERSSADTLVAVDSSQAHAVKDSVQIKPDTAAGFKDTAKNQLALPKGSIDTKNVNPQELLAYAQSLIGTPYRYGSTNPAVGFDCSGFITHVFSHFNLVVPRSSIDFTHVGKEIAVADAKPRDIILFTGTDSSEHFVGHMGLVMTNQNSQLSFIHSTSGKAHGVTITPLNDYYKGRYVKTIRIFPANGL
jgi:cell wall-associated NlpC family hydrolase